MPGVDFNREAFVPAAERAPRPPARMLGSVILLIAVGALVFLGYRLLADSRQNAAVAADTQAMDSVQQQLTRIEKRLDQLERHRKTSTADPEPASKESAKAPVEKSSPRKTVYTVAPPNSTKTQSPAPLAAPQASHDSPVSGPSGPANDALTADREAWQATTDRLADVVGVVGSQEGEIAEARQQLNTLLAQTRRNAIQFELRRGASPQPVGPVSLVLKGSDQKSQRYTICVYVDDKCVELKNRSVNEVSVFVLSGRAAPLEIVATKVLREEIIGYLAVPSEKTAQ